MQYNPHRKLKPLAVICFVLLTVALICAGIVHFGGAGDQVTLSVLEGSAIGGFFFRLFA